MKYSLFFLGFIFLISCSRDKIEPIVKNEKNYIFLGHAYDWNTPKEIDPRLEILDYNLFDGIWLGGDICSNTTGLPSTVDYLDNLFDLSNPTTHFALGNHDIQGDLDLILDATTRNFHYSYIDEDITYIVLNTNTYLDPFVNDCDYLEDQFNVITNTITECQTPILVLLMHHAVFPRVEPEMGETVENAANAGAWQSMTCEWNSRFKNTIYPFIKEYKTDQNNVYIIAGDGGQYSKKYFFRSNDGIEFYISGINNSFPHDIPVLVDKFNLNPDSILLFKHDLINHKLDGKFVRL